MGLRFKKIFFFHLAMKIYIEKEDSIIEKNFSGAATELLEELKINPTTVVVIRNNELINEKVLLNNKDDIKILSVISGG